MRNSPIKAASRFTALLLALTLAAPSPALAFRQEAAAEATGLEELNEVFQSPGQAIRRLAQLVVPAQPQTASTVTPARPEPLEDLAAGLEEGLKWLVVVDEPEKFDVVSFKDAVDIWLVGGGHRLVGRRGVVLRTPKGDPLEAFKGTSFGGVILFPGSMNGRAMQFLKTLLEDKDLKRLPPIIAFPDDRADLIGELGFLRRQDRLLDYSTSLEGLGARLNALAEARPATGLEEGQISEGEVASLIGNLISIESGEAVQKPAGSPDAEVDLVFIGPAGFQPTLRKRGVEPTPKMPGKGQLGTAQLTLNLTVPKNLREFLGWDPKLNRGSASKETFVAVRSSVIRQAGEDSSDLTYVLQNLPRIMAILQKKKTQGKWESPGFLLKLEKIVVWPSGFSGDRILTFLVMTMEDATADGVLEKGYAVLDKTDVENARPTTGLEEEKDRHAAKLPAKITTSPARATLKGAASLGGGMASLGKGMVRLLGLQPLKQRRKVGGDLRRALSKSKPKGPAAGLEEARIILLVGDTQWAWKSHEQWVKESGNREQSLIPVRAEWDVAERLLKSGKANEVLVYANADGPNRPIVNWILKMAKEAPKARIGVFHALLEHPESTPGGPGSWQDRTIPPALQSLTKIEQVEFILDWRGEGEENFKYNISTLIKPAAGLEEGKAVSAPERARFMDAHTDLQVGDILIGQETRQYFQVIALGDNGSAFLKFAEQITPEDSAFEKRYSREELVGGFLLLSREAAVAAEGPAAGLEEVELITHMRWTIILATARSIRPNYLASGESGEYETLATIAKHQASAGLDPGPTFTEALAVARSISEVGDEYEALAAIAEHQASAGQFTEALATARSIPETADRPRALAVIAEHQASAGLDPGPTFIEALDAARFIDPIYNTDSAYSKSGRSRALAVIAEHQASAGLDPGPTFTEALAVARSITEEDEDAIKSEALAAIAEHQASVGQFTEALATARSIGNWDRSKALAAIAKHQASAGQFIEALATIRSTNPSYSVNREFNEYEALAVIAEHQASAGLDPGPTFAEALAATRSIRGDNDKHKALAAIAEHQALAGQFTKALATARSIAPSDAYSKSDRSSALAAIAEHQASAGQFTEALATARSIVSSYSDYGKPDKSRALAAIAKHLASAGLDSGPTFIEALDGARSISSRTFDYEALVAIAEHQASVGQFTEALVVARSINGASDRYKALVAIAEHQASAGLDPGPTFTEALAAARSVLGVVNKYKALAAIAGYLGKIRVPPKEKIQARFPGFLESVEARTLLARGLLLPDQSERWHHDLVRLRDEGHLTAQQYNQYMAALSLALRRRGIIPTSYGAISALEKMKVKHDQDYRLEVWVEGRALPLGEGQIGSPLAPFLKQHLPVASEKGLYIWSQFFPAGAIPELVLLPGDAYALQPQSSGSLQEEGQQRVRSNTILYADTVIVDPTPALKGSFRVKLTHHLGLTGRLAQPVVLVDREGQEHPIERSSLNGAQFFPPAAGLEERQPKLPAQVLADLKKTVAIGDQAGARRILGVGELEQDFIRYVLGRLGAVYVSSLDTEELAQGDLILAIQEGRVVIGTFEGWEKETGDFFLGTNDRWFVNLKPLGLKESVSVEDTGSVLLATASQLKLSKSPEGTEKAPTFANRVREAMREEEQARKRELLEESGPHQTESERRVRSNDDRTGIAAYVGLDPATQAGLSSRVRDLMLERGWDAARAEDAVREWHDGAQAFRRYSGLEEDWGIVEKQREANKLRMADVIKYADKGRFNDALREAEGFIGRDAVGDKIEAMAYVAGRQAERGLEAEAIGTFGQALGKLGRNYQYPINDRSFLELLIGELKKVGFLRKGYTLPWDMDRLTDDTVFCVAQILGEVGGGFASAGLKKKTLAEQTFEKARGIVNGSEATDGGKVRAYCEIAQFQARSGFLRDAEATLGMFKLPPRPGRLDWFNPLGDAAWEKWDETTDLIQRLSRPHRTRKLSAEQSIPVHAGPAGGDEEEVVSEESFGPGDHIGGEDSFAGLEEGKAVSAPEGARFIDAATALQVGDVLIGRETGQHFQVAALGDNGSAFLKFAEQITPADGAFEKQYSREDLVGGFLLLPEEAAVAAEGPAGGLEEGKEEPPIIEGGLLGGYYEEVLTGQERNAAKAVVDRAGNSVEEITKDRTRIALLVDSSLMKSGITHLGEHLKSIGQNLTGLGKFPVVAVDLLSDDQESHYRESDYRIVKLMAGPPAASEPADSDTVYAVRPEDRVDSPIPFKLLPLLATQVLAVWRESNRSVSSGKHILLDVTDYFTEMRFITEEIAWEILRARFA
ncbi:MAG: hypothetical protein HYS41_02595 [Candidatus Omnitrophica bacterium]|nr:hypothetical protein [Candidatus Omnitrophota bacterium]